MAIEITMDHPQYPKGTEFDVAGVLVKNGSKITLSEDQELSFVSRHGMAVKDKLESNEFIKVTGTAKFSPAEVAKIVPEPAEAPKTEEGSES